MIVVGATDGLPLANVEVERLEWSGTCFVSAEPAVTARTDDSGRCVLPKPYYAARVRVSTPPPGLAEEEADVAGGSWTILRLVPGGTVRATALTAEGRPCADIEVGFITERGQRGYHDSTPVDSRGTWVSEGLKPGTHWLTVWAAGQRWGYLHTQELTVVAGRATDVTVALPPLVPLAVALTGEWPPGVVLELERTDVESGDDIHLWADGSELRTMLVGGCWNAILRARGMVPQGRELQVPGQHVGLREEFVAPTGRVTFRLRDEQGAPLGSLVDRCRLAAVDARGGTAWAGLNERGESTLDGLAPGQCALALYSGWGNPSTARGRAHLSGAAEVLVVRVEEGVQPTYTYTPTTYFPTYYPTRPAGDPRSGR